MRHESELEQMVNLLAFSAEIMRRLARGQEAGDQQKIENLAGNIEDVAEKLVEAIYPGRPPPQ